jgi:hypothetical protein
MRARLKNLAYLPALLGLDTTRHLTESWPPAREIPALRRQTTDGLRPAPRRLAAQAEEVTRLLSDVRDTLATSADASCRSNASSALALLAERFEAAKPTLTSCEDSCRSATARMEEFVDAIRALELELADCRRGQSLSRWLLEKETGLKGSVGVQGISASNPRGAAEGSQDSQVGFLSDARLEGSYRSETSWHSADLRGSFARYGASANEFDYDLRQSNVLQYGTHAFRIGGRFARANEWLWSDERRGLRKDLAVEGGWRRLNSAGRALEILGHFRRENLAPSIWSKTELGAEASYVLTETLHDEFKAVASMSRLTLKDLDAPLWVTSLGVAYEQTRASSARMKLRLGLQDRRATDLGSGLWPEFFLGIDGTAILESGLSPYASLEMRPEATPWAPTSLTLRSHSGLKYVAGAFEIPADFSLGQVFHAGAPAIKRQDRLLELGLSPRYRLSDATKLALTTKWTRFWLLRSETNPAVLSVNYPRNSYKNFEASLRMQYEF